MELLVQLLQVPAHDIAHLDVLEVVPSPLVPRVEAGLPHYRCRYALDNSQ
jgi:hypothetical protein